MSDATPALDEAFERMAAASFELPNGFVNHGAMACEALAMLDSTGDMDSWARRFAGQAGHRSRPGGSMAGLPAGVSEIFDKSPAGHHAPGGDPVSCQRRAAAPGELI